MSIIECRLFAMWLIGKGAKVCMQATRDMRYLSYGEAFIDDLYNNSWVGGGWASLRSVATKEKEDHMHSFFLAETCKYLFLLYNDTFLRVRLYSLHW